VISGGYITEIGESLKIAVPKDSQVVDATGKFLIPGLWDAHVHLANLNVPGWGPSFSLPLLVANGVTGVRDMGGKFEVIKALRKQIADGALPGPHIIAAGPQLGGASKDQEIPDMWLASTPRRQASDRSLP
jgi:imidazolonepropionase-like amidohydrolase